MKLITEEISNVKIITEGKGSNKKLYIEGVFLQGNLKNRNGRMYPMETLSREVSRYNEAFVQKGRALGELGHPDGPTVNLDRVSHLITSLKEDGNNYIGRAKILDTPMGNIARNLIEEGAQLGVSSRGLGSLKERNGINEVQDDFMLSTAADIVSDPSAPDAFVRGIMENREWIMENGCWREREVDMAKAFIHKTSARELEEAKLVVFESFMQRLSKI